MSIVPVAMMLIFTFIFNRVAKIELPINASTGRQIEYPVFAYCGLLFWTCFATSLTQGTPSLVVASGLIKKCAFPRQAIPLAKVLAPLLDLAIGALLLLVLMISYGTPITLAAVAVPGILVLQLVFTYGLALVFSAANMYYRDVNYLVQVGLLLAMFATAVVYAVEPVNQVARKILSLNPMSAYLNAYRDALLLGRWPGVEILTGVVGAAISLGLGALVFRRLAPRFAEEV